MKLCSLKNSSATASLRSKASHLRIKAIQTIKNRILLKTLSAFAAAVIVILIISLILNDRIFVYVLDDPYIHMTIARNFTELGLWAANGMDFSSSTSSPLWTLLISAVFFVTGANVYVSLILNILFSVACIYSAYYVLKKSGTEKYILPALLLFIFCAPLPSLVFTGMEHTAQILFSLLFIYLSAGYIRDDKVDKPKLIWLIILSLLMTSIRYEGFFMVFTVVVLMLIRKRYAPALLVLAFGLVPIVIYGYISTSHDWLFFPNPLLVKSKIPEINVIESLRLIPRALKTMLEPDIIFILPPLVFSLWKLFKNRKSKWELKNVMLLTFTVSYLLHMTFAQTGWFYRYEAYLVAVGIIVLFINIHDYIPSLTGKERNLAPAYYRYRILILSFMAISILIRISPSLQVPIAANNIHEQHYQMAMFVKSELKNETIAANDIGMLSYYSGNKIIDLWGLTDIDVARKRISKSYNPAIIDEVTRKNNVKYAIVYEHWFDRFGGLPAGWKKIAEWKMTKLNIACGAETVAFYSLDEKTEMQFREKLESFSGSLPKSVIFFVY
jgi:hypothetical protein